MEQSTSDAEVSQDPPPSSDGIDAIAEALPTADIAAVASVQAMLRPRSPQRPTGPIIVPPKLRPMPPKRRFNMRPSYIVLAGMLIGLTSALYFRSEISRAIPALDMVYGLLGVSTTNPAEDLETANLVFNRRNEDGKSIYSVQADVFNKSEYPVALPIFVIKALDDDRQQVGDAYPFRLEQKIIEPGETITFRTFIDALPKGTKTLRIEFSAVQW